MYQCFNTGQKKFCVFLGEYKKNIEDRGKPRILCNDKNRLLTPKNYTAMKTQKLKTYQLIAALLTAFILTGCMKENPFSKMKNPDFKAIEDNALADNIFADVFNQGGTAVTDAEAQSKGKGSVLGKSGCPTITISPFDLSWPKLITLDYGTGPCLGSDGRYRSGIVYIHSTGEWRSPGTVVTITFDDYYIDNHAVEGTKTITNNGRNANNNLVYEVDVQNAKITKPDNTFLTWGSLRQHEWIEGEETILNPFDDGYLITGSYAGVSSGNESYTIDIIEALYIHTSCQWIRAGILDINIQGMSTVRIDYGNGDCNAHAEIIYEGHTYPLVMQ